MNSSFESLSTKLLFEVFDYLSPFNLFRTFLNLNIRLNTIVHSHPLRLDFRPTCRSKFDFICRHLEPKQVISLILCDESVPDGANLFLDNFRHFEEEFLHLQSVTLIEDGTTTFIDLGVSVSSLSIRSYDKDDYYKNNISEILSRQTKVLTHLKIDSKDLQHLNDIRFPAVTHMTIIGGRYYDYDCECIDVFSSLENTDAHSLIQQWQCSLTHLYLVIDNNSQHSTFNLDRFSDCLTHLTLRFYYNIEVSFACLEQCLIKLFQLTNFTCQAGGSWDLIDGERWEQLILKTGIIRFNFKFRLNLIWPTLSKLEPFRSLFWLTQRHWYVGCYQNESEKGTILHSIPRFQIRTLKYPSAEYPHITTAPLNIEQSFSIQAESIISLQIQYLDVANIHSFLTDKLENLIAHTPRVTCLSMKFDALFVIPSHIRYLLVEGLGQSISLDRLSYTILSVERLEISIASKQMIIDIIDRFNSLENLDIFFDDGGLEDDCMTIFKDVSTDWLVKHTYRPKSHDFTCLYSRQFHPSIYLSFGNRRKENDNQD